MKKWNSPIGLTVGFMKKVDNSVDWMGAKAELFALQYNV